MSNKLNRNIKGLYPPLRQVALDIVSECWRQGHEVMIYETSRTWARQVKLWREGRNTSGIIVDRSKVITYAAPGWSPHNYGLAFDIVFLNENGGPSWDNDHNWQAIGNICTTYGLEWGGNWSQFKDRPHCQKLFRPVTISKKVWYKTLRSAYWLNKRKEAVWKILDKKLNFS